MQADELIRAWKDPESRTGDLPAHPAGEIDLDLAGAGTTWITTILTTSSVGAPSPTATTITTITTVTTTAV